jgi:hypothetical protein
MCGTSRSIIGTEGMTTPRWPFPTARLISASHGVDRRQRDDALRDEALADRDPFLDQKIVVRLHAGQLELRIGEVAEGLARPSRDGRIEHRIIHAIDIHRREALAGRIGYAGHFLPALRFPGAVGHGRTSDCHARQIDLLSVNHPALGAIGLTLDVRDALAPLRLRHALRPDLRVLLDVIVGADESVFEFHVLCQALMEESDRAHGEHRETRRPRLRSLCVCVSCRVATGIS